MRMREWVAMLSPSEVPVAVSGTCLVSMLLAMVFMRLPDTTSGMQTTTSNHSVLTPAWRRRRKLEKEEEERRCTQELEQLRHPPT